jgi:peptidoglycan hydrolase-like protein with peptidoglycan-binding domain
MKNKNFLAIIFSEILLSAVVLGLVITAVFMVAMPKSASAENAVSANASASASSKCIVINNNLYLGASDRFISGSNVARLQAFLIARGYLHTNATGFYGPQTFSAIKRFQKDNGILSIGLAGPITRAHIQKVSCDTITPPVTGAPVINGIDSPSILSVNQTGTWTVRASDTTGGGLSYSVVWGDEYQYAQTSAAAQSNTNFVQSATFTHVYAQAGVYTPRFYVRGSNGLTAEVSASVQVSNQTQSPTQSPIIASISPTSGTYGTVLTVTGSGFTRYNNSINYAGRSAAVVGVESANGTTLQFTVPATPCTAGMYCAQVVMEPGTYAVSVTNQNSVTSNIVYFALTSGGQAIDQTVNASIGSKVTVNPGVNTLEITPLRIVEESRCPVGVYCIQAGRVVVETQIQVGNTVQVVNLAYGSGAYGGAQLSTSISGYTVSITNVSPQARQGGMASSEYVISYRVVR